MSDSRRQFDKPRSLSSPVQTSPGEGPVETSTATPASPDRSSAGGPAAARSCHLPRRRLEWRAACRTSPVIRAPILINTQQHAQVVPDGRATCRVSQRLAHEVSDRHTTQYDTTKAAVAGLTRGMAADHAADGIRVNAVCPGPIYTPFHEKRIQALGRTFEQYRDDAAKGTLLRRHGTPDEVAACILFLASDDASYVTGTLLFVGGGCTAM